MTTIFPIVIILDPKSQIQFLQPLVFLPLAVDSLTGEIQIQSGSKISPKVLEVMCCFAFIGKFDFFSKGYERLKSG